MRLLALRLAAATGVAGVLIAAALGMAQPAWAQDKPAAEAPKDVLRPPVAAVLQAVQALLVEGKAAEALLKIRELEAQAPLQPFEAYLQDRLRGAAAVSTGDDALAIKALSAALATGRTKANEQLALLQTLAALNLRTKDHEAAARWAREYFKAGGNDEAVRASLVRALYAAGDCAATLVEVKTLIEKADAAGRKPGEDYLKVQANCQAKTQDMAGYGRSLERLLELYPSADYWADVMARLQRRKGYAERLQLDWYRLSRHLGLLESPDDYSNLAQLAMLAGLPGEAQAVLDEGFATGVLGKGAGAASHKELQVRATKLAREDLAQLADAQAQALKAAEGDRLLALGQALISYGDKDKGLALMQQGLARGIKRQAEDARLRYGVALLRAGKRAEAEAELRQVRAEDGSADLARLWLLATRSP